jgi:small subunit ribosomal protein S14
MSAKLVINKEYTNRILLSNNNLNKRILNLFNRDLFIPIETRTIVTASRNKYISLLSCKTRNRCIISGRARAVSSYVKLTRMMFKNLATKGALTGISKHSW